MYKLKVKLVLEDYIKEISGARKVEIEVSPHFERLHENSWELKQDHSEPDLDKAENSLAEPGAQEAVQRAPNPEESKAADSAALAKQETTATDGTYRDD